MAHALFSESSMFDRYRSFPRGSEEREEKEAAEEPTYQSGSIGPGDELPGLRTQRSTRTAPAWLWSTVCTDHSVEGHIHE